MGNREILVNELGESRVALGTITIGATLLEPGLVKVGGEGKISIEAHPAIGAIKEALKSADFKVEIVDDARSMVWSKLIVNAAINPLTALLKVPNGELLERPTARGLMRALAEEAASVASAEKIILSFRDPALLWKRSREKRRRIIRPCCKIFFAARRLRSTRSAAAQLRV